MQWMNARPSRMPAAGVANGIANGSSAAICELHLPFDHHAWLAHRLALRGRAVLVWLGWCPFVGER